MGQALDPEKPEEQEKRRKSYYFVTRHQLQYLIHQVYVQHGNQTERMMKHRSKWCATVFLADRFRRMSTTVMLSVWN